MAIVKRANVIRILLSLLKFGECDKIAPISLFQNLCDIPDPDPVKPCRNSRKTMESNQIRLNLHVDLRYGGDRYAAIDSLFIYIVSQCSIRGEKNEMDNSFECQGRPRGLSMAYKKIHRQRRGIHFCPSGSSDGRSGKAKGYPV